MSSNDAQSHGQNQEEFEITPENVDASDNADAGEFRLDIIKLFTQATEQTRMALCISDPYQEDAPIIYVNEAFVRLTGYPRDEVIGRNCRFLQGEDTDPSAVEAIRDALDAEEVRVIDILNYRKDGQSFWNALHVGPIYDEAGDLQYYYGSQWDVTEMFEKRDRIALQDNVAEELQHRTGNLFAAVNAIINLSARGARDVASYRKVLTERINALHRAHVISIEGEEKGSNSTDLRTLICSILEPYELKTDERLEFSGDSFELPRVAITPIGLAIHELATNSLKYGALGQSDGRLKVAWRKEGDGMVIDWQETIGPNGRTNSEETSRHELETSSGTGKRIMDGVLTQLGGTIRHDIKDTGLHATIRMPKIRVASR